MPASRILGVSTGEPGSAACLVIDGRVVAAAEEERFTRSRRDVSVPANAIAFCLRAGGLEGLEAIDHLVCSAKPLVAFHHILESFLAEAPRGLARFRRTVPEWLAGRLDLRKTLRRELGYHGSLLFGEHHESLAASAFHPSPFERAATLTVSDVGERAWAIIGRGRGHRIELLEELWLADSPALLATALGAFCGLRGSRCGEELMELSPAGEPRYFDRLRAEVVAIGEGGAVALDRRYFEPGTGMTEPSRRMADLVGGPPRLPESPIGQRELDLAASVRKIVVEALLGMAVRARAVTGEDHLVLAGGPTLDGVANDRLRREGPFDDLWIQPAGEAGSPLGAALHVHHQLLGQERSIDPRGRQRTGLRLGPSFGASEISVQLAEAGPPDRPCPSDRELVDRVAALLADGRTVGWFQGPLELGRWGLGGRIILADPRDPATRQRIDERIKLRESLLPLPAVVLEDAAQEWFGLEPPSPSPVYACPPRSAVVLREVPALFGSDGLARVRTASPEEEPLLCSLLERFRELTGCPTLVSETLAIREEPVVCTPAEAYRAFRRSGLDALVVGRSLLVADDLPRDAPTWDEGPPPDDTVAAERLEARRFGLILAGVLTGVAALSAALERSGTLAVLGLLVGALTLGAPGIWTPLWRGWSGLARTLGRVVTDLALGVAFAGVVAPIGLLRRLLGRGRSREVPGWHPKPAVPPSLERARRLY